MELMSSTNRSKWKQKGEGSHASISQKGLTCFRISLTKGFNTVMVQRLGRCDVRAVRADSLSQTQHSPGLCPGICCVFWLTPHIGALRKRQQTNRKSEIKGFPVFSLQQARPRERKSMFPPMILCSKKHRVMHVHVRQDHMGEGGGGLHHGSLAQIKGLTLKRSSRLSE